MTMGRPTGFLDFTRQVDITIEPMERIKNFEEFHRPLPEEFRRRQAARCMDCGVPFCQSGMIINGVVTGCPLHNLIPEWNDMLYGGNNSKALERLLKTNDFPEFTGRVCPAPCEAACVCGLHGEPVTTRENELWIIEDAFDRGLIRPEPPKSRTGRKIAVIGSGPAGLAAAVRLNRRGHEVTVFERRDRVGGLLTYGIPGMKLSKYVVERRIGIMEAEGVVFQTNSDIGVNVDASYILDRYDSVILCCGASKPRIPEIKGFEAAGVYMAMDYLTSVTRGLLDSPGAGLISARDKKAVIIGNGDTATDCVATAVRQCAMSVTQFVRKPAPPETRPESNPWPQWPVCKRTEYGQQEAISVYGHDPRRYGTLASELYTDEAGNLTGILTADGDLVEADMLIIAAGFAGAEEYVCRAFGVDMDQRGNVRTPVGSFAASVEKVFSAGDMRRGQSLVAWAISEGREAAREADRYLMGYSNL